MSARRRSLPSDVAGRNARMVADRALDLIAVTTGHGSGGLGSRPLTVGATVADDGELDPLPLVTELANRGARIAYPHVDGDTMTFALVESAEHLVVGPGRVRQAADDAPRVDPADLDIVLVPLVAFDLRCERLGRGRGHYDRTFVLRDRPPPLLIGLAHDEQLVDDLAPEPHDVALDHVVTPSGVISRSVT